MQVKCVQRAANGNTYTEYTHSTHVKPSSPPPPPPPPPVCCVCVVCHTVQSSATFKYLNLRCRGEAPDTFLEQLTAALSTHKHTQQQLQQQQQQQQSAPWSASSGPVSHPISGALTSGSFTGPLPPHLWLNTQQQQQQQGGSSGGGALRPPRSPLAGGRGLQAVDGELLGQLVDMVRRGGDLEGGTLGDRRTATCANSVL